jgi:hypothetical protein
MAYDPAENTISVLRNEESLGVAYENVSSSKPLYPALVTYDKGLNVSFVDF